jgi:hypothetical protein
MGEMRTHFTAEVVFLMLELSNNSIFAAHMNELTHMNAVFHTEIKVISTWSITSSKFNPNTDQGRGIYIAILLRSLLKSSDSSEQVFTHQFHVSFGWQLLLKSKTRYYSRGSIIADSRENANALIVISAGQVNTHALMILSFKPPANKPSSYSE